GFEYAGELDAQRMPLDEADELPPELADAPHNDPVRRMHEIVAWQTMAEDEPGEPAFYPPEMDDDEDADAAYAPPTDDSGPDAYELQDGSQVFYPPVTDDEDELKREEYIGEDEAETAKRVLWDKLFRGGKKP
ncbi:MAG: hypothetical protein IH607_04785, partial [Firmicutes bacterium]|nr:hypothetical protein [Bacillota bacterium]